MVMTEMSFTAPAIVEHAYYLNWGFKRDLARVEGRIGARWLFVDDLLATGKTRVRVRQAVDERASWFGHATEFVGTYVYGASGDPSAFYGPHHGRQP